MEPAQICPICKQPAPSQNDMRNRRLHYACPTCGKFVVESNYPLMVRDEAPRPLLSGVVRQASDRGEPITITVDNRDDLERLAPRTVGGKTLALLRALARRSKYPGDSVQVTNVDRSLCFAENESELVLFINHIKERGFFVPGEKIGITGLPHGGTLTLPAWEYLEKAERPNHESDRAFVAMWFGDEMTPVYNDGIAPAILEAGYVPIRIDRVDHNNRIDDQIIAEIRRSRFLVADFTGHRGGVYYEAGFAQGLGLDVIWSCRADAMKDLHFDTRQYPHLVWKEASELKEMLRLRILAIIGEGPGAKNPGSAR